MATVEQLAQALMEVRQQLGEAQCSGDDVIRRARDEQVSNFLGSRHRVE